MIFRHVYSLKHQWPFFVVLYYLQFRWENISLLKNSNGSFYKLFKLTNAYKLKTKKAVSFGRVSKEDKSTTQNNVRQHH